MLIRRKSGWTFDTSKSRGASAGFVGIEGGTLWLTPPNAQTSTWFNYATVGVGASVGLKLGASFSGKDFPNRGDIWILPAFKGNEWTSNDITGFCTAVEITIGPVAASTAMFLGISAGDFYKELGIDAAEYLSVGGAIIDYLLDEFDSDWPEFLQSSANALLVMEAVSASPTLEGFPVILQHGPHA
jgi:hypothetical protein